MALWGISCSVRIYIGYSLIMIPQQFLRVNSGCSPSHPRCSRFFTNRGRNCRTYVTRTHATPLMTPYFLVESHAVSHGQTSPSVTRQESIVKRHMPISAFALPLTCGLFLGFQPTSLRIFSGFFSSRYPYAIPSMTNNARLHRIVIFLMPRMV